LSDEEIEQDNAALSLPIRGRISAPMASNHWTLVWFTLIEHPWTSIVIVPSEANASSIVVARALADVGNVYEENGVQLIEAERLPPAIARHVIATMTKRAESGARTVVAVSSPLVDYNAIPIARAADASILLVKVGATSLSNAKKTVSMIGKQCFIGSITSES
jgi:hypothetical protein